MRRAMGRSVVLLPLLASGCIPDRELLAPVAEAWGQRVAEEAEPGAQAALGLSAVTAALCRYSLEDWQGMGTAAPALPEAVAAWFGVSSAGVLQAYPARGQFTCTWSGTAFRQPVALRADVATPMTSFTLSLSEPREEQETGLMDSGDLAADRAILASMVLSTSACGTKERLVSGRASFPVGGDLGWVVELVPAEGKAGVGYPPDAGLPASGALVWTGIADVGRAKLTTHDAAQIGDDGWPATAGGRGWSSEVTLALP